MLAKWTPSFSAHATRAVGRVKIGLAEVNEAALRAKSRLEVVGAYDRWRILLGAGSSVRRVTWLSRRVVGWQAEGMGVIFEVLLGLLVLRSRRDRVTSRSVV